MGITICKSSAGSGKTHKLTHEYLLLVIDAPLAFRSILAVTFTNKATEEMKERIISELFRLAHTPSSSSHARLLMEQLGIASLQELSRKASICLKRLLFDYSRFNVSTIDSFVQQILRSFARELGQYDNYSIDLDENRIMQETVDRLFQNLDETANQDLFIWLERYYESLTEGGYSWNVKDRITELSLELLRGSFKRAARGYEAAPTKQQLTDSLERIKAVKISFESEVKRIATQFVDGLLARDIVIEEDFKGKSRSPFKALVQMKEGKTYELSDKLLASFADPDSWTVDKSSKRNEVTAYFTSEGESILRQLESYYLTNSPVYKSADLILRNIFVVGILANVKSELDDYSAENNTLLISQSSDLLNELIDGSSTPFVYEKIASNISNYMIDEFQDTSDVQWENFKPLIDESVAGGNSNLIVGDVKQSIYRWRDSNWSLLGSKVASLYDEVTMEVLNNNHRSKGKIIRFNNDFFNFAVRHIQQLLNELGDTNELACSAYADVHQNIASPKDEELGHVSIEVIAPPSTADGANDDSDKNITPEELDQQIMLRLKECIMNLFDQGYSPEDIGILVRYKKEARKLVSELLAFRDTLPPDRRFSLISPDGLLLSNSFTVRMMISAIELVAGRGDCSRIVVDDSGKQYDLEDEFERFGLTIRGLQGLTLIDMCYRLRAIIPPEIIRSEEQYEETFFDFVLDFQRGKNVDAQSFVEHWEKKKKDLVVKLRDSEQAIRIMTVHSAKGLAFRVVIVPYASWDFSRPGSPYLWCVPTDKRLDIGMPIPLKPVQGMKGTLFETDYLNEMLASYIDSLNTAYVAFTRARERMYLFTPEVASTKTTSLATLLNAFIEEADTEAYQSEELKIVAPDNELHTPDRWAISSDDVVCDVSQRRVMVSSDISANRSEERLVGIRIHEILSEIRTLDDVPHVRNKYSTSSNTPFADTLERVLTEVITSEKISSWFAPELIIYNERSILVPGGSVYRPDRMVQSSADGSIVVIDYKFGQKKKFHQRQVTNYMTLVKQMGIEQVRGYIWYPLIDELIELA